MHLGEFARARDEILWGVILNYLAVLHDQNAVGYRDS